LVNITNYREEMRMSTPRKSFGIAFVMWLLFGGFGAHRIYIQEKVSVILWYWLAVIGTLTIIVWIDVFRLKSMIDHQQQLDKLKAL
jgi:TM2 domain-containing membrane protein YozV